METADDGEKIKFLKKTNDKTKGRKRKKEKKKGNDGDVHDTQSKSPEPNNEMSVHAQTHGDNGIRETLSTGKNLFRI